MSEQTPWEDDTNEDQLSSSNDSDYSETRHNVCRVSLAYPDTDIAKGTPKATQSQSFRSSETFGQDRKK